MDASTLRRLALLNLSTEQMSAVLELLADIDERDGARKAKTRERVRRCRERKKNAVTLQMPECNSAETLPLSPKRKVPPHPLKENNPYPAFSLTPAAMAATERCEPNARSFEVASSSRLADKNLSTPNPKCCESGRAEKRAIEAEFHAVFWPAFPNKCGKPKALGAFLQARGRDSLENIMAGLNRYIDEKPPDRPWLNPTTFLNQERWNDQPAPILEKKNAKFANDKQSTARKVTEAMRRFAPQFNACQARLANDWRGLSAPLQSGHETHALASGGNPPDDCKSPR